MRRSFLYIPALFLLSLFSACNGKEGGSGSASNLPNSSSVPNELLVVMDSAKWKGELGDIIRDVFGARMKALPQEEAQLNLRYSSPRHFKSFLKLYPNILFVAPLDDNSPDSRLLRAYFTKESLNEIRTNKERFYKAQENVYARNQDVLYLFSATEEELKQRILENMDNLQNFFVQKERERIMANLRRTGQKKLAQHLSRKHGFSLIIPQGYEIAIEDDSFAWIRLLDDVDRSIWFTYMPFTDESIFQKEKLLELRNREGKKHIWGSDSSTYLMTEPDVPVETRELNFNGHYAVEMRGLWRLNNMVMGGPFVSYALVDETNKRLYYIEGFVYAPGEKKREAMREIEAILWSFKLAQESDKKATKATASGGLVSEKESES